MGGKKTHFQAALLILNIHNPALVVGMFAVQVSHVFWRWKATSFQSRIIQAKCVKDESLKIKRDDASVLSDSTAKFSSPYTLGLLQPKYGDFSLHSQRFTTSTGTFIAKNLLTCLFLQVKEKELKEISS